MEIKVAKTAGFCAGVKRAVDTAFALSENEKICTYGSLIHNKYLTDELEARGVEIVDNIDDANGRRLLIRAHGVPPEVYAELKAKNIEYTDCSCVDVLKIHRLIESERAAGKGIIIAGAAGHPEIIALYGAAGHEAIIIGSSKDVMPELFADRDKYSGWSLVSQTTFIREEFDKIVAALKEIIPDLTVHNTICRATSLRQEEARELSRECDVMIVLGDKKSSNSLKLYEICKETCEKTYFIEGIEELQLKVLKDSDKIGITAGASTPPVILKEAVNLMSDLEKRNEESFEEMLGENIVSLHTGATVKGTVISTQNGEVSVNLGYKSDGLIQRSEFSDDPDIDPSEVCKPGDEIEVFVVRVNDADGNVLLSKKKVDSIKAMAELEAAVESKAVLKGKIIEAVKGGAIAIINGQRAFVPSSQISNRYVEDIESFKGKELEFNILEFDRSKRKIIAGRKELAARLIEEQKAKAFDSIEVGQVVEGVVSRIVDFGVFVDLGGVDGLIHVSELAWSRVRKPSDILSIGDKVSCYVMEINKEKGKISLSIKNLTSDPWSIAEEKYAVGTVCEGKVVRITAFGAFIALEDGIDGLLHISQIAEKRIQKVEDVLSIGDVIMVKVTDLNLADKKISLSKKAYDKQRSRELDEEAMAEQAMAAEASETEEPEAELEIARTPEVPSQEIIEPKAEQLAAQEEIQAELPKDEFFEKDNTPE